MVVFSNAGLGAFGAAEELTTVPAPRRLVLGSDAYQAVQAALTGRLSDLEAGKALAATTDFPA